MRDLVILGASSFLLALLLTPLFRNWFQRIGFVDRPDEHRKLHHQPIPHLGGVPLVLAYAISVVILTQFTRNPGLSAANLSVLARIAPAALMICVTGILDDCLHLKPLAKLSAQLVAAGAAVMAGVQITGIASFHLAGWLSIPVTMLWLIACTNAFNLIDGVDGLAAGVGLFATATTLIAALMQHNLALAVATAPLVGALLGFLRYNFNPATIFLGDSGSLWVGFLLGCFGVIWSQKSATILGMTAPLMALSIPILDVCLSVGRRYLRNQPILSGDRGHIHHRLLDRGLSPRRAVLILYALCGVGAILSLLQSAAANRYSGAVILVFCGIAWIGIQNLGYTEFEQARKMIVAGGFRAALNAQLSLRAFSDAVAGNKTPEEKWDALRAAARTLGFARVSWRRGYFTHNDILDSVSAGPIWVLKIALGHEGHVEFAHANTTAPLEVNVASLAEVVQRHFSMPELSGPLESVGAVPAGDVPQELESDLGKLVRAASAGYDSSSVKV